MSKEALNMARIAEQTERYQDMVRYIKESMKAHQSQRGNLQKWLGQEQMRLLGTAYKCKINSRRTAWRALSILYAKEANSKNRSAAIIQLYKESIEKEIREIAQEAIATLDNLQKTKQFSNPLKLQACKMRGDFHRYLCEIAKDTQQLKRLQKQTENAYRKGITEVLQKKQKKQKQKEKDKDKQKDKDKDKDRQVQESIQAHDPRRLAIYLNLSVYFYQIAGSVSKAIQTCEQGFTTAIESISDLQQAKYIDSVTIMQLMHDNITAWRTERDQKK